MIRDICVPWREDRRFATSASRYAAAIPAARNLLERDEVNRDVYEDHRGVQVQGFDQAVGTVREAFVGEGFTITPIDGGDVPQTSATGDRRRYALIEAA